MGRSDLDSLRKNIAQIDDAIVELLVKRFDFTDEVGRIKNANNIPVENLDVERKTVERLTLNSEDKLDKQFISDIYTTIFTNSKERQRRI